MQAFNHSLTNVSMNSPYYREWQPPLSSTNVFVTMKCSLESLWRLFAIWLDGRRSRAPISMTKKREKIVPVLAGLC